jgi:hypothetical protein
MRANARMIVIDGLRDSHRWLDEFLSDPDQTLEARPLPLTLGTVVDILNRENHGRFHRLPGGARSLAKPVCGRRR